MAGDQENLVMLDQVVEIHQHLVILLMVVDMVVAQDIVVLLMEDVAVVPVMQITQDMLLELLDILVE